MEVENQREEVGRSNVRRDTMTRRRKMAQLSRNMGSRGGGTEGIGYEEAPTVGTRLASHGRRWR